MDIIRGKIQSAKKVVVYGPEGIGKSTFASKFANPVFIDVEGSTQHMDVARTPQPSSFSMLKQQIQYFIDHPSELGTLVIDTADWAERLCTEEICSKSQKAGIEDFGYGKGYVYVSEEIGRMLDLCTTLKDRGVNVVITAHAFMRKFEQPDELGSYDRWELKLGQKTGSRTSPLLKEWADLLLFANYKTIVVNVDGQGAQKGKNKVQGGKRVMYTTHHSCWDAKNRFDLPEEMPFEFSGIAHLFGETPSAPQTRVLPEPEKTVAQTKPDSIPDQPADALCEPAVKTKPAPDISQDPRIAQMKPDDQAVYADVPKVLLDLLLENHVRPEEVQFAVARRGYYPNDTPISRYEPDFIKGCLVGAWPQVYEMIQKNRAEVPF
ncbi:MAG: ATP-binding protein [Clostridia bacterium]